MILQCLILSVHLLLSNDFAPSHHAIIVWGMGQKGTCASKVFMVNGLRFAKSSNPTRVLFGPIHFLQKYHVLRSKKGSCSLEFVGIVMISGTSVVSMNRRDTTASDTW